MAAIMQLVIMFLQIIIPWILSIIGGGTLTDQQKALMGKLRYLCRQYCDQCQRLGVAELAQHSGTDAIEW